MDKFSNRILGVRNPKSVSSWARRRRWAKFVEVFPEIEQMHVLDLGGTPWYWRNAPVMPAHVTTVNLRHMDSTENITAVQGDVYSHPPGSYDLVISNSLIEHVGGHSQRARLADVIAAAADRHWVQTPYRYFPIEPHWLAPGIQFLPFEARVKATMLWKFGHCHKTDRAAAVDIVNEIELIGLTQMRAYFPDSDFWLERVAGLVKSMVAFRA